MTIAQMRDMLMKAYPSDRWKKRVEKMRDPQIVATYNRIYLDHTRKAQK